MPACHFRKLLEREDDQLPIVANHRRIVMSSHDNPRHSQLRPGSDIDDLPSLASFANDFRRTGDKALAVRRGEQDPLVSLGRKQVHYTDAVREVDHQSHRFAKATPAGELVCGKREEASIFGRQQDLVGCLGVERKGCAVAFLEFQRLCCIERDMALHRAHPATLRHDDGDRLALDHRLERDILGWGSFGNQGAALADFGLRAVRDAERGEILLELGLLARGTFDQQHKSFALLGELVAFGLDLEFLKAAQ